MSKQPTPKRLELMRLSNADLAKQGLSEKEITELRSEQQAAPPDRVQVYRNTAVAASSTDGDIPEAAPSTVPLADTAPTPTTRRTSRE